jgi:hypothetical protein
MEWHHLITNFLKFGQFFRTLLILLAECSHSYSCFVCVCVFFCNFITTLTHNFKLTCIITNIGRNRNSFPSIPIIGDYESFFRDVFTSSSTLPFFISVENIKTLLANRVTKIEYLVSAVLKLSLPTVTHETSLCLSSITKRVTVQDPNTRWE